MYQKSCTLIKLRCARTRSIIIASLFFFFRLKGKSTSLSGFYRIARNIASQWQPDPIGLEFDERYWDTVREGDSYICVHTASIDTSEHGYGFPSQKSSPNAKHPWNLKNLCQNPNSVLRSMGNVIGKFMCI